jgi:predicted  nucleic acid-binding Zn-ribbon protein
MFRYGQKSTDTYIEALLEKDIDIAPLEEYTNVKTHILHECLTCGHEWKATPNKILSGRGCPSCSKTGYNPDLPGTLYYIKIENFPEIFYKIGITNRSLKERFERDKDKTITVLLEKHFEKGSDASKEEKEILQKYKSFRQNAPGFLKSGGNTELFEEDILGLDK